MKVKCISAENSNKELTENHIYEVVRESSSGGDYELKGVHHTWGKRRFIACIGTFVRCDDATEAEDHLTKEHVYKVAHHRCGCASDVANHYILDNINGVWLYERFTVVPGRIVSATKTVMKSVSTETDPVSEAVAAFFMRPPAGCCPCGLLRGQCSYHQ